MYTQTHIYEKNEVYLYDDQKLGMTVSDTHIMQSVLFKLGGFLDFIRDPQAVSYIIFRSTQDLADD